MLEVTEVRPNGTCSFTGEDGEVPIVSTEDGFLSDAPISLKGLRQLAKMKLNGNGKKPAAPAAGDAE